MRQEILHCGQIENASWSICTELLRDQALWGFDRQPTVGDATFLPPACVSEELLLKSFFGAPQQQADSCFRCKRSLPASVVLKASTNGPPPQIKQGYCYGKDV